MFFEQIWGSGGKSGYFPPSSQKFSLTDILNQLISLFSCFSQTFDGSPVIVAHVGATVRFNSHTAAPQSWSVVVMDGCAVITGRRPLDGSPGDGWGGLQHPVWPPLQVIGWPFEEKETLGLKIGWGRNGSSQGEKVSFRVEDSHVPSTLHCS